MLKLLPYLESPESWKASPYGQNLKFCDHDTLKDVQGICKRMEASTRNNVEKSRKKLSENLKKSTEILNQVSGGNASFVLTGMRSAAPLSLQSKLDLPKAHQKYWRDGTIGLKNENENLPNPMIASLLSEEEVLHYGTDPILGFHLATAYAPLVDKGPSNIKTNKSEHKAAAAAQIQFSQWVSASRILLQRGLVLRFALSDVFALCHSLQHAAASGNTSANWYRRQWDAKTLKLDAGMYGKGGEGPLAFDVIDTSNLSDHVGALNILVATAPLLKDMPWAAVYTELLIKREDAEQKAFDSLLCGPATTMSLLLGVSPVQNWTNAKAESHVDEMFLGLSNERKSSDTQSHSRLVWKRDDQISGQLGGRGSLHFEPKALAKFVFQVYLQMFRGERLNNSLATVVSRNITYSSFHRGTLAVLLKLIKQRVVTDWQAMCVELMSVISRDQTRLFGSNHLQELGAQLHMSGIFSFSWVFEGIQHSPSRGTLKGWENIPPVIAVTFEIPRRAFMRLWGGSKEYSMASPTLAGTLKPPPTATSQWHNMYGDVHIVFGKLKTTSVAESSSEISLEIQQDRLGWEGSSSLFASFYAPTSALQVEPEKAIIGLNVMPTGQSSRIYTPVLGLALNIFETTLSDEKVHLSRFMPGQSAYRVSCDSVKLLEECVESHNGETKTRLMANVWSLNSHISTLTGHLDILSGKGKKLLKDKVPVELYQATPFVIEIVFVDNDLSYPLAFPMPVTKEGSRTRIARTSGYIEVIAPLAEPIKSQCLADYVFPTTLTSLGLPVALNLPYVNLDNLLVLDLQKKADMRWLTTLTSFQFSTRERAIRDRRESFSESSGVTEDVRVDFKESLFTMFMLSSGLQGGQTGLFSINHPEKGGIHMLIFVSALRLDGDTASVVLDAAVIPLTNDLITSKRMETFLLLLRTLECCSLKVNDAELVLWKKILPSFAERCRTWSHGPKCEYKKQGATLPLSLEQGTQVICSCGNGVLPDNFINIPEWETAAPNAVRIAISPTYAVPFVEEVVDTSTFDQIKGKVAVKDRCRSCGKTSMKHGGALKKCSRCQEVQYCSVECQKKDWKTHRMECK